MIRIEKGREVRPGVFAWRVPQLGLEGRSHQPNPSDPRPMRRGCGGVPRGLGRAGSRLPRRQGRRADHFGAEPRPDRLRQVSDPAARRPIAEAAE
jgi:hypothetical protein